jgi:hypothetical protein
MKLTALPKTPEELLKYEAVILYDPAFTENSFDKNFVGMLEDFVSQHHGGVCYIAGNKFSHSVLGDAANFGKLADLLPIVLDRQTVDYAARIAQGDPVPWPVSPTAVGMDHPTLRLGKDVKDSMEVWDLLPGVYWSHPVLRLKPLASALAVNTDPTARSSDLRQPAPVIAVQYYGKGRVLYIGTDETWRWRVVSDGSFWRKFWFNVVDFLGAGGYQNKRIIITTGADRFAVGDEVKVQVEAYDRQFKPLQEDPLVIQIIKMNGDREESTQDLKLGPDPKHPGQGRYEAILPIKLEGTYLLTAKRGDEAYADQVATKTIVVTQPEEELRHPEADPDRLKTMAPEGKFLPIQEADGLVKLIGPGRMTVYHDEPHDLWDVPLALTVIVVLLGIEWILRKRSNMM